MSRKTDTISGNRHMFPSLMPMQVESEMWKWERKWKYFPVPSIEATTRALLFLMCQCHLAWIDVMNAFVMIKPNRKSFTIPFYKIIIIIKITFWLFINFLNFPLLGLGLWHVSARSTTNFLMKKNQTNKQKQNKTKKHLHVSYSIACEQSTFMALQVKN